MDNDDFTVQTIDRHNRANILAQAEAIHTKAIELSKMPELKDLKDEARMRMMPLHSTMDTFHRVICNERQNSMASAMYIRILERTISAFNELIFETKLEVDFFTRRLELQENTVTQLDKELSYKVYSVLTSRLHRIDADIQEYDLTLLVGNKDEDVRQKSLSDIKVLQAALSEEIIEGYNDINSHYNERCKYLHDLDATTSKKVAERKIELYREHLEKYADLHSKEEELLIQHHNKLAGLEVEFSMFKEAIRDSKYK